MALMAFSMSYTLRKNRLLVRQGKMKWWLRWHHWAGFFGGTMALGHTMGNLTDMGTLIIGLLLLVMGSSGIYYLEKRSKRPLNNATTELSVARNERKRLDTHYRDLYASGMSSSPQGLQVYKDLLAQHAKVVAQESEVSVLREKGASWTWWRHLHNVGTMMLVGVLLVHIWSKLYFAGVVL
jgi:hypothetical protein